MSTIKEGLLTLIGLMRHISDMGLELNGKVNKIFIVMSMN